MMKCPDCGKRVELAGDRFALHGNGGPTACRGSRKLVRERYVYAAFDSLNDSKHGDTARHLFVLGELFLAGVELGRHS